MRSCLFLMVMLFASSCLMGATAPASAESGSVESFTLADGRVITGIYDQDAKQLIVVNDKTGKHIGTIPLAAEEIASRQPVPHAAPPAAESSVVQKPAEAEAGAQGEWIDNYDRAMASAKATQRPVLMDFTGSDWCGWCIRLHQEVFDTKEFKDWASQHVILLVIDLPHHKTLPADVKQQNEQLAKKYSLTSVPTIYVLDAAGKTLGKTSYLPGGPRPWIADLVARAHLR